VVKLPASDVSKLLFAEAGRMYLGEMRNPSVLAYFLTPWSICN